MEDYVLDRMTEYLGGVMVIQYTLAASLDELGLLPKAKLAEVLRNSAQNDIQEPGAVDAAGCGRRARSGGLRRKRRLSAGRKCA